MAWEWGRLEYWTISTRLLASRRDTDGGNPLSVFQYNKNCSHICPEDPDFIIFTYFKYLYLSFLLELHNRISALFLSRSSCLAVNCILILLQVLFDDLGSSLIRISNPSLQFQLLCSFLQFLGVPSACRLLPSFFYLAMDENNIFDNRQYSQGPLTSFDLPVSGISRIGCMDPMVQGGRQVGHPKEGEEFIQNFFHMMLPLFSGKEKSDLSVFWLQYEISKVRKLLSSLLTLNSKLTSKYAIPMHLFLTPLPPCIG